MILNFLYKNKIGRIIRPILTIRIVSKIIGWTADRSVSRFFIKPFIKKHQIDMSKFIEPSDGYKTFNEFFYRSLKPGSREIDTNYNNVISPADSKLFAIQELKDYSTFFIKECKFNLAKFLKNEILAEEYKSGTLLLFRLAPTDYHRFHFPFDCIPGNIEIINGKFESVNPTVYKSGIQPLTENERHLIKLNSEIFGQVLCVPVGAMFVGKIHATFQPNEEYKKGTEMGYFAFGASSLVMIFKPSLIKINETILQSSANNIETQVKMGQAVARTTTN